jgi:hypothetical protein
MPIPAPGSDQPAVICCDRIFNVTQQAAIIAGEAVRNCFGEVCAEMPIYVSHGEPVGGGDYVAAWLASITPPPVSTAKTFFVVSRLNIGIAVCLTGFPRIEVQGGDFAPLASPDDYTRASYFSYGAMEAAYQAIVSDLVAKPGAQLGGCTIAGMSQLFPNQPAAGNVRWAFQIYLDYRP